MATTADAEVVMRLYELRREETLRKARRFMVFDFRPKTLEELRAVSRDVTAKENASWRQVLSYWEMAAAMVLHGAVSAELFVDCNGEGFFLLAKFSHILEGVREQNPGFLIKTSELVNRFSAASQRYEVVLKALEARRARMSAK